MILEELVEISMIRELCDHEPWVLLRVDADDPGQVDVFAAEEYAGLSLKIRPAKNRIKDISGWILLY